MFGGEVSTGGVGDKVVAVAIKILKSGTRSEDKVCAVACSLGVAYILYIIIRAVYL